MIVPLVQGAPVEFLSPSFRHVRGAAAYELKFLIGEATAAQIEAWVAGRMEPDPHGDPAQGNAYRVTSVYCDTDDLAVYHRVPLYNRRKFRLRRYGEEPGIFLERKSKWGKRLVKRRTWVAPDELERLDNPALDPTWAGLWFRRHLNVRRLRPRCLITYERQAFFGDGEQGAVRLTLDRNLVGGPHRAWHGPAEQSGRDLLEGDAILELKFSNLLPVLFRRLIYDLALAPRTTSKYRRAVQLWGLESYRCPSG